jgi:hypothetical protein
MRVWALELAVMVGWFCPSLSSLRSAFRDVNATRFRLLFVCRAYLSECQISGPLFNEIEMTSTSLPRLNTTMLRRRAFVKPESLASARTD